jgi:hypothetical protein
MVATLDCPVMHFHLLEKSGVHTRVYILYLAVSSPPRIFELALKPEVADAAVIEGIIVDRMGNYSCPLASGAIFASNMKGLDALDPCYKAAEAAAVEFAVSCLDFPA